MFNLKLTTKQLAVLYTYIKHTRLGDINKYRDAISDLAIQLEKDGIEEELKAYYDEKGIEEPSLGIEYTEAEGIVLNIN